MPHLQAECQVVILGQIDIVLQNLAAIGRDLNDGFTRIEEARKTEQDNKVLKALPHIEASYHAFVNTSKSRFLGDLEAWAEGSTPGGSELSSKPICILTGAVGTGKSTIASEFAKRLNTPPHGAYGASFFFDCQVEDLTTTKFFFTTIAHELAHVQAAFRQPIIKAARQYLGRGLKHQQITYGGELVRVALGEIVTGHGHSAVLLVVDAVDECTELVPDLLDILQSCVDVSHSPFPLRVFITSRPDHSDSTTFLSKYPASVQIISLDDPSSKYGADEIPTFLRIRFLQTVPGRRVFEEQPQLVTDLASLANRSFVFARTAMDSIESVLPEHYEATLRQLLADSSSKAPPLSADSRKAAPRDPLDGLYLTILKTAFPSGDMESQKELRTHLDIVLGCIALLSDYLSPRAIEAFTSISPEHSLLVLHKLRAVVLSNSDEADGVFRPMHASFPQFLVDPARCTNPLYLVDKPREHASIAQGCLNVVVPLSPGPGGVGVAGTQGLADVLGEHVLSSHVRYACLHWALHLGEAKKTTGLTTALDKFATQQTMQKWVETLGHLGRLDVAETALDSAAKWEEPNNPTRGRLEEARKLVVDHYQDIEKSPSAVYSGSFDTREDSAQGARGVHRNPAAGKLPSRKSTEYFDAMPSIPGGLPKDSV